MIVTNGSPKEYSSPRTLSLSWEECLDYCLDDEMCMVVSTDSSTSCQVFEIGMLQSVERSVNGNEKVGFKTLVSSDNQSTCPADDTEEGNGYYFGTNKTSDRQVYNGYSFAYDPVGQVWNFASTGTTMCPHARWMMFVRQAGPWCLAFVTNSFCSNQSVAVNKCPNLKGVLSGLETKEEYEFIEMRANESRWFNTTNRKTFYASWVDGTKKSECVGNPNCQGIQAFSFTDPTISSNPSGYIWNPNEPQGSGEDCLGFRANPDGTSGIFSFPCGMATSADNTTCFTGYICGAGPT